MSYKVNIIIEKDDFGFYAYCPELDGCQTQGNTLEEVMNNISISFYQNKNTIIII
jgi:predicted RNase H-like HicB family nuclease